MAAGLPTLAYLNKNSSGIEIIKSANCGLATSSNNKEFQLKLIKKIYSEKSKLPIYKKNGINYANRFFSKNTCVREIFKLINSTQV